MKKIIQLILLFSTMLFFEGIAQRPGDTKVLASRTSLKGRVELSREKKVQRKEKKMVRRAERANRRKLREVKGTLIVMHKKKRGKEKKHKESGDQKPPK